MTQIDTSTEAVEALLAERDALKAEVERLKSKAPRVRHIKRGSVYEVLGRGKIQTDTPLGDYAEIVVYRCEEDGNVWVRPVAEFDDPTRFEQLPQMSPPPGK